MEFTPEIKAEMIDDIERIKKMLTSLQKEIAEIEKGNALEFIAPLMTIGRIEENVKVMRGELKDWQDEGVEYMEFP